MKKIIELDSKDIVERLVEEFRVEPEDIKLVFVDNPTGYGKDIKFQVELKWS